MLLLLNRLLIEWNTPQFTPNPKRLWTACAYLFVDFYLLFITIRFFLYFLCQVTEERIICRLTQYDLVLETLASLAPFSPALYLSFTLISFYFLYSIELFITGYNSVLVKQLNRLQGLLLDVRPVVDGTRKNNGLRYGNVVEWLDKGRFQLLLFKARNRICPFVNLWTGEQIQMRKFVSRRLGIGVNYLTVKNCSRLKFMAICSEVACMVLLAPSPFFFLIFVWLGLGFGDTFFSCLLFLLDVSFLYFTVISAFLLNFSCLITYLLLEYLSICQYRNLGYLLEKDTASHLTRGYVYLSGHRSAHTQITRLLLHLNGQLLAKCLFAFLACNILPNEYLALNLLSGRLPVKLAMFFAFCLMVQTVEPLLLAIACIWTNRSIGRSTGQVHCFLTAFSAHCPAFIDATLLREYWKAMVHYEQLRTGKMGLQAGPYGPFTTKSLLVFATIYTAHLMLLQTHFCQFTQKVLK